MTDGGDSLEPVAIAMRVFVGVKIAPEIADELAHFTKPLEQFAVRRIAARDIHLTLVPPWNENSPVMPIERLRMALGGTGDFTLTFTHVGYGPDPRRPRYLWVICAVNDEIAALRTKLLMAFGQSEERPFRPHVTLVRLREKGRMIARKCPIDRALSLTQQVRSIELFRSPPAGETGYRVLASLPLSRSSA
jgi:2'-5' RNA ligase